MNMAFRIRGIYSTALTQFFLENDYIVADPSEVIQNRFSDFEHLIMDVPEDIVIKDMDDDHGIRIEGETEVLSRIRPVFESSFS